MTIGNAATYYFNILLCDEFDSGHYMLRTDKIFMQRYPSSSRFAPVPNRSHPVYPYWALICGGIAFDDVTMRSCKR